MPPRQHLAERPRLAVPAHQRVEVVLGRLVVGGADAEVARRATASLDVGLHASGRAGRTASTSNVEVGPALAQPLARPARAFEPADGGRREQVAVDVVRLVDVRLDERDARDARVAGEQVEHGHPAAAGADLEEVGHATHVAVSSEQS